jgi:hypothetical protein
LIDLEGALLILTDESAARQKSRRRTAASFHGRPSWRQARAVMRKIFSFRGGAFG